MLITCAVEVFPCPVENQAQVIEPTIQDFAEIGVTPESMASAIGFGFAFVLVLAFIPMVAGWIIKMINKL